jgi:glucose-1-phosphate thymidylyltransferase
LVITTPEDQPSFKRLLGTGEQFGIQLSYATQPKPEGIAQAFIIAEDFIGTESVCLVLGDNIFYGYALTEKLVRCAQKTAGATVFGFHVTDPERFGVVEFDQQMNVLSIEEKPTKPKSKYAITGLYFYNNHVVDIAKHISPSARGELEITCINNAYLAMGQLNVELLGRGHAWLDTGTHESLLDAGHFVRTIEQRQGLKIACLEEIAFNSGWISKQQLLLQADALSHTSYGQYLSSLTLQANR